MVDQVIDESHSGILLSAAAMRRHQREFHGLNAHLLNSKPNPIEKKRNMRRARLSPRPSAKQTIVSTLRPTPTLLTDQIYDSSQKICDSGCLGSNGTVFDHTETASHLFTYSTRPETPQSALQEPSTAGAMVVTTDERLVCRCTTSARMTGIGRCAYCTKARKVQRIFALMAYKRERRRIAEQDPALDPNHIVCGYCGNLRRGTQVNEDSDDASR
jgi:hypothetical protein